MNRLKSFLSKDFFWKVFSLAVAVCLWLVVLNVENPVETRTFTSYIEIQNENAVVEQNKTILNMDEIRDTRVSVRVRGNRITLDRLSQGKDVTAYIDLSSIGETYSGNEAVIPVKINLPSTAKDSVSVEYINPANVTLKTDNLISKDMEVIITKEGFEMDGFETGSMTADPPLITVYGPQGEVDKVSSVGVAVDVSVIGDDRVVDTVPSAYDAEGNIVEGVFLSSSNVAVNVDMKSMKIIGVEASVSGVAADGYVIGNVSAIPENIFVVGEQDVLSRIESIVIDSVNVFGRKETFTTDIYIANYLPGGVSLRSGLSEKVQLTVEIEPQVEAEVKFSTETVEVLGYNTEEFDVIIENEDIDMIVCGNSKTMEEFDETLIAYNVDLSGLAEGKHSVGISCELPEGVMIYGDRPIITLELVAKEPAEEETE